jgi:hypothetical protein
MRLVLDACVLFPTVLREILTGCAQAGGYVPLWSARLLEEWARAAARLGPAPEAIARGEIALLRAAFPDAEVPADPVLEQTLHLPDLTDRHVLATAIRGRASGIVTLNLRDFPARALAPWRIDPVSPDDMLMGLWLTQPGLVEMAVAQVQARTETVSGRRQPLRPLLRRAKLPRLGKALGV